MEVSTALAGNDRLPSCSEEAEMNDCAGCVVDDVLNCRNCLAEALSDAEGRDDQDEAARLQYMIHVVDGVITAVRSTVTAH